MSLEEQSLYQKHNPERGDRYMIAKKEVPDGELQKKYELHMCN
jgi:hypothetical protein